MSLDELLSKLWAKGDGTSIREHTNRLIDNLKMIKETFGDLIEGTLKEQAEHFWKCLELACEYHDYGKIHCYFQKKVGNPDFKGFRAEFGEVRHNLLSPAFLPEELSEPWKTLVALAIVHHHDYEPSDENVEKVEKVLKEEFKKGLSFMHKKVLKNREEEIIEKLESGEYRNLKTFYTLLKGFLLRIDHASSSKFALHVESDRLKENEKKVESYLRNNKNANLNELQNFVLSNRKDNLLIVASTGAGKTEAGFIFLEHKGFFTIPIRTSANAIYQRAKQVFDEESVGLLHSTAHLYLLGNAEEDRNFSDDAVVKDMFLTKNFGKPLIVSTPDQLFPFILRPKGFEKYYSLFSYSRVALDEVQLFEPHTLGFIVKAIEKLSELGGRLIVMTATLPSYLEKDLEKLGFKMGTFLTIQERHNIKVFKSSILSQEGLNLIKKLSQRGKVLVVVNTVAIAIELKKALALGHLLHARFIYKDRKEKEREIEEFFRDSNCGVWITTQIAEVSLDLDADFLITELSTIDSLFQRMGRVNRFGRKETSQPNVFVFTENCSGISRVYRKSIHEFTKEVLKEGPLSEEEKQTFIKKVYEEVAKRDKEYMKNYEDAKRYIDDLWTVKETFNKEKAQHMFRDILTYTVIPERFRDQVERLIKEYKQEKDYLKRLQLFSSITEYMFNVPVYVKVPLKKVEGLKDVFWIEGEYSAELGFEFKQNGNANIL